MHRELDSRSTSSELEERGILRGGSESSILKSRVKELEQNMKKDFVHRELDNRPELAEMEQRGLLSKPRERA